MVNLFSINIKAQTSQTGNVIGDRSITLSESRGMIYDCNMKKLVNSTLRNVTVALPTVNALNTVSPHISSEEKTSLYENMSNGKVSVIYCPNSVDEDDVKTVTVTDRYSDSQTCVHVIGHLDENGNGANGLEKAYNSYLSMQNGLLKAVWSTDAQNRILYGNGIRFTRSGYLSSAGIQLTIDADIQKIAENTLSEHGILRGAAVIMDADTAEILASASVPVFNPNDLSTSLNDENSPFINRAAAPYNVGSVFKPFVAACAIDSNTDDTVHNCIGRITVGNTTFGCNENTAHGIVTLKTAMEKSCNSYFIALGQKVGSERILSLCSAMGFGKEAELADNFYLRAGYLPTAEDIASPQDLANLSFGQGKLMVSPIQMAAAYCAFANGGMYRPPTLMKGIIDENGEAVQRVRLPEGRRVLSKTTVEKVDELLRSVVTDGNGVKAFSPITDACGKTATAQTGQYIDGREINHTWFCGYFHTAEKTFVAVILKEDGSSGAVDCAPVFRDISEKTVNLYK